MLIIQFSNILRCSAPPLHLMLNYHRTIILVSFRLFTVFFDSFVFALEKTNKKTSMLKFQFSDMLRFFILPLHLVISYHWTVLFRLKYHLFFFFFIIYNEILSLGIFFETSWDDLDGGIKQKQRRMLKR